MKIQKQKFGRTDLKVSRLCLGTSNFARYANQDESFAILDEFRAAGGNFFQTSGMCPGVSLGDGLLGLPEELLGRWLHAREIPREHVVIATRIALTRPVIGGMATYAELMRTCVEDSVRRIGCVFLDLLVVEWMDALSPLPESVAALEALIRSRRVRHIVPANFAAASVVEALALSRLPDLVAGVQLDYSMVVRNGFETGFTKLCADYRLAFVARSPLAGGHLAGCALAGSAGALRQRGAEDDRAALAAAGIRPVLSAVSRAHGCSTAAVALAWVLAHPQVTSVLVSVRSIAQLRDLVSATRLELSENESKRLDADVRGDTVAASAH